MGRVWHSLTKYSNKCFSSCPTIGTASMTSKAGALDRGNAGGRATRELLMRTAERLFAERGFEAVPLREIGREAEQRNPAVTQYHFGTRDELVREIYAYRSERLNQRRFELLRDL